MGDGIRDTKLPAARPRDLRLDTERRGEGMTLKGSWSQCLCLSWDNEGHVLVFLSLLCHCGQISTGGNWPAASASHSYNTYTTGGPSVTLSLYPHPACHLATCRTPEITRTLTAVIATPRHLATSSQVLTQTMNSRGSNMYSRCCIILTRINGIHSDAWDSSKDR